MIVPKKIIFSNFLSFYGDHEYPFADKGIHLIKGINLDSAGDDIDESSVGSGKSSFTFIIQYAFFGEIEKRIQKDKIINKEAGKNLSVIFEFESDKHDYRIERYRKHIEHKNDLFLKMKVNNKWKDISKVTPTETQKAINDIIVVNNDTFLKSILFSREDKKQFFELILSERIKIFENIIQLNKFVKYLKRVKKKKKEANEKNIAVERDIAVVKSIIKTNENNMDDEQERLDNKKENLNDEIKILHDSININSSELDNIVTKVKKYNGLIDDIKKINELSLFDENLLKKMDKSITTYEQNIENYTDKIFKLEKKTKELKPIKCWKCKTIQNEDEYNDRINNYKDDIKQFQNSLNTYNEQIDKYADMIKTTNINVSNYKKQKKTYKNKIKELDLDDSYKSLSEESIKDLQNKNEQIKQFETEISLLDYDGLKKYKTNIKTQNEKLKKLTKEKTKIDKKIEMLDWWIAALDIKNERSIKSHIMSKIIPVFNNLLQQNIDGVYNGEVSVLIDQVLNETIIKDDKDYEYNEFSTGEKLKLNLCSNLSTFDMTRINLSGCSLLYLDEIFGNVDPKTIKNFLEIFKSKYAKNAAVYIISHRKVVEENIEPESITIIQKENERSTIIKK